jgi:hypothetical protein
MVNFTFGDMDLLASLFFPIVSRPATLFRSRILNFLKLALLFSYPSKARFILGEKTTMGNWVMVIIRVGKLLKK